MKRWLRDIYERYASATPERFFLITAALVGCILVFVIPPVAGLDEEQHFYRAYQVSDLNIKADKVSAPNVYGELGTGYGGDLPASVIADINGIRNSLNEDGSFNYSNALSRLGTPLRQESRTEVRFDNTAIYSPLAYMPQAIGMSIGKLFNASPVLLSYMGRITTLITWIALAYLSIKLTPRVKWVFVVILLNPASIFLASTLSADVMSIGLIAVLVASILRLRVYTKQVGWRWMVLVALLIIAIALQKNAYMFSIFALLAVPSRVLPNLYKSLIIFIGMGVGLLWNVLVISMTTSIPDYFSIDYHVSSGDQLVFILHHMPQFIVILMFNIFGTPNLLFSREFAGLVGDTTLPFWVTLGWILAVVLAATLKEKIKDGLVTLRERFIFLGVVGMSVFATIGSLYIGWNEVGARTIQGVQSRYYIPISLLIIPVIMDNRTVITIGKINKIVVIKSLMLCVLIGCVVTLMVRYKYGV